MDIATAVLDLERLHHGNYELEGYDQALVLMRV
jgi:hypothetical protein